MKKLTVRNTLLVASLIATAAFSGQSYASQCKGLDNGACSAKASCSWVEGYERKDGRTVKSFCRTKSVAKQKSVAKSVAVDNKPTKK